MLRGIIGLAMILSTPWLLMQAMDIWIDAPSWLFAAIGTPTLWGWCILAVWIIHKGIRHA